MAQLARTFVYRHPRNVKPNVFPAAKKPKRAKIHVFLDPADMSVLLLGNTEGLLYLAKHIAGMALHVGCKGHHIHMNAQWGKLDKGSRELTIDNTDWSGTPVRPFLAANTHPKQWKTHKAEAARSRRSMPMAKRERS